VSEDIQIPESAPDAPETQTLPVRADERYALSPNVRRFLFVDVAAQRAKQLRKGALNRIALAAAAGEAPVRDVGSKPERIAMEEVRRGFIQYELPDGSPLNPPQEG
jgi:DNA-directed RNA polymerase subunit K/omega